MTLFLSRVSKCLVPGLQANFVSEGAASAKGVPPHLFGRPVQQHRHPEEESRSHPSQEVHFTAKKRKW